jgi:predicted NBD/HSP70 family sugar kinase
MKLTPVAASTATGDLPSIGIGIDIGGTSTKGAVIDRTGAVIASTAVATERGADGVVLSALRVVRDLAGQSGVAVSDVDAIGIGIPGTVDPRLGTVRFAVNVGLGAERIELGSRLAGRLGRPVHVENDVRAAALGADWLLAASGAGVADLAYLSIGTGIAAGYVARGRLHRGAGLVAGEIGHLPIDPAGPVCACGQTGCIEAIASGSAIERAWPTPDGTSAIALQRAVAGGNVAAEAVWSRVIGGLASAVLMLALTLDPEVIVIGGGVAAVGQALPDAIAARLVLDARHSEFLRSLDLGSRLRIVDPTLLLGPIGAVRAAYSALVSDVVVVP